VTKQRSLRGTLASKAREALFSTFGEHELPVIKTNAPPSDVVEWKRNPQVASCYKKLFEPMENDSSPLSCILTKIFPDGGGPEIQIAFVIAICTTLLNPQNENICAKENIMKLQIDHYKVSLCDFILVFIYYIF
jgi:hypothetical protein